MKDAPGAGTSVLSRIDTARMSSDATRIFAADLTRLMECKDWAGALHLAAPAQARLARCHPHLPLLIALFNAADRMTMEQPQEASAWMPRIVRALEDARTARG